MESRRIAAPAAGSSPRQRRGSGVIWRWLRAAAAKANLFVIPLLLLVLWQLSAQSGWVPSGLLASPTEVWHACVEHFADGSLSSSILVSLRRVFLGSILGISIGLVLGLFSGLSRLGRDLFDGPMNMLHAMPFPALLPLLMIWLGIDESLKVGLVAIGVVFPIFINFSRGIRGIDPRYLELAKTRGVTGRELFRCVIFPGALPSLLVGLRYALAVAWLCLVFAETIATDSGIGYMMMEAKRFIRTDTIILCLVIYSILGLAIDAAVRLVEYRLLPWRRDFAD